MKYGYCRVSTSGQARYGNSLEAQIKAVQDAGAENVYFDEYTGTKVDRPALENLLSEIKKGDMLIVTKLDRIARSTTQGIELIEGLMNKGVSVNVLNMGIMDDTPTGRLIRTIFLAFAQFERDMIVERTREGREIAKTKEGYINGRPRKKFSEKKFQELRKKQKDGEITVDECCKILKISRSVWYVRCQEVS